MDFINKLIKKGIFCLIFVFGLFIFSTEMKVSAATCSISLNDGDKYLVLSVSSKWNDSGVTANCGQKEENITVKVNNGNDILTTDSAEGAINSYVTSPGFYTVQYSITGKEKIEGETFVTRQIRVLPKALNNGNKNIWLGQAGNINTTQNDEFVKMLEIGNGYLIAGNFDTIGYVVKFNAKGESEWVWKTSQYSGLSSSKIVISDIVKSDVGDYIYYISGSITKDSTTSAFIKPLNIFADYGINNDYGTPVIFDSQATKFNEVVVSEGYIYAAGYLTGSDSVNTGVIVRKGIDVNSGELTGETKVYSNVVDSQYNAVTLSSTGNIIAVGNQAVSTNKGAIGGSVTVCSGDFVCQTGTPNLYLDQQLGNTTITRFNDVIENNGNYLIVGETRASSVNVGSNVSYNSGVEDKLIILGSISLTGNLTINNIQMSGGTSSDSLYEIRKVSSTTYMVVGSLASSAYYAEITVDNTNLTIDENVFSGNSSMSFEDVFVRNSNGETQYLFVGKTKSTVVEGVINPIKGSQDALFIILDKTQFSNYDDINVLAGNSMCADGTSFSCSGSLVNKSYWLKYGSEIAYPFIGSVSTSEGDAGAVVETIHEFTNSQGIKFKIGRKITVVAVPVPGDIQLGQMGIEKWYLYSRNQVIGENVSGASRKELWNSYYYPVEDGQQKTGQKYYVFNYSGFAEDTSQGLTQDNYILLANEPQATNVGFQSIEKARKFSLLQEFTRIAFVKEKYNNESGIIGFPGELNSLLDETRNYYFVYYIDSSFGTGTCEVKNFKLIGNCNSYQGYAFASLERIKEVAELVLLNNNYFVSESNSRFNVSSNISLPKTSEFIEEMATERYLQELTLSVPAGIYLNVEYYAIDKSNPAKYTFGASATLVEDVKNVSSVIFSPVGKYKNEGKYVVKYCYSSDVCGASATFIIDRTAPIVNYSFLDYTTGVIDKSWGLSNLYKLKGNANVTSISDIDPYAYILVSGKKYYLRCNEDVNSSVCDADFERYVTQSYAYDKNNPDKIHDLHIYDRAGNKIDIYLIVATSRPTVDILPTEEYDSFTLVIDFYEKNRIDSFEIEYTSSETCEEFCTNASELTSRIMEIINTYIYLNDIEKAKVAKDANYDPEYVYSIQLVFSYAIKESETTFAGGALLPKIVYDENLGYNIVSEEEIDPLPLSKGLYDISITDVFYLQSTITAGIGLEKAKLYIYENDDKWHVEDVSTVANGRIPKTIEEFTTEDEFDNIFKAKVPNTYKDYIDLITTGNLKDLVDKSMYFTQQFIYVKFKENAYGITEIKTVNATNIFGNPTNYTCQFVIYGSGVNTNKLNAQCTPILLDELSSSSTAIEALKNKGIYIVGKDGDDANGYYYYLAFTKEGFYNVLSKVDVDVEGGKSLAVEVSHTFSIDVTKPDVELVVDTNTCKGEKDSFTEADFLFTASDTDKAIPNIGRCSMKINLKTEYHNGLPVNIENRLLLVRIGDELYNAYDYTLEKTAGEYLLFEENGVWEIEFLDAALNSVSYKFRIDKTPPVIAPFVDDANPNNDINQYQQYIKVKISVQEESFVNTGNASDAILTVYYSIDSETPKPVTIKNNNGVCELVLGAVTKFECDTSTGVINLSFVLSINEDKRESKIVTLKVTAEDYFGNSESKSHPFKFDNNPPYIYYNTANYTPITIFGENVSNDDRKKMITVDSDASLGNFICDGNTETLVSDKINCGDTPSEKGVDNGVIIEAYEAYRIANNNFTRNENGSSYTVLNDGEYLNPQITIYSATYTSVESASAVNTLVANLVTIYEKQEYVKIKANEKINPNVTYYYSDSKTPVSIKDMYSNSSDYSSCSVTDVGNACHLYYMYNTTGTFTSLSYYEKDENHYVEVAEPKTSDYTKYYYITSYDEDVDYSDNYLPALILPNSRAKYDGSDFFTVPEGAIKLIDEKITYYNVIERGANIDLNQLITITNESNTYALKDTRIWQIAKQGENEVKFSFVLPSALGRPIIFKAKDKAGNYSSNHLETVIVVKDKIAPTLKEVHNLSYVLDDTITSIDENTYIKTTEKYKVIKPEEIVCDNNDTKYYGVNSLGIEKEANCGEWEENVKYYAVVDVYQKATTYVDGEQYYRRSSTLIEDKNYLTKDNFSITFSEPIYKIVCSYYDRVAGVTKVCSLSNTEFDYSEEKNTFEFVYEGKDTYVNYDITVYDFSENETKINYLYIDREKPIIEFNDSSMYTDIIEVDYTKAANKETNYTENYIVAGFRTEISAGDSVDTKISSQGHSNMIKNELKYSISFYKFNHNVTYKNYIINEDGEIEAEENGVPKESDKTYYVLVKQPADYVLKDVLKCEDNGYCYVKDDGNYYTSLLEDDDYWDLVTNNTILKDKIGVYKVVYIVTDYSGNVSSRLTRTVYVVDTTTPKLSLNGNESSNVYGYHNNVIVEFINEGEGAWYQYTCSKLSLTCELPTQIFAESNSEVTRKDGADGQVSAEFNEPGVFKVYFHDRGRYVSSEVSHKGTITEVMTLRYNFREYQFVIDKDPPVMNLNAYTDEGNMYYKVDLKKEESLYCVKGKVGDTLSFGSQFVECRNLFSGTPSTTTSADQKTVVYTLTNNNDDIVYSIVYEKLEVNQRKYFYNTYYKKLGDEFISYEIGQAYDENNVYIVTLIELYFRDDGRYLIQAKDKAGNVAGRQNSTGVLSDKTQFDIDNTAPSYNKNNTAPTGINFWYSVPKEIVKEETLNYITQIADKGNARHYDVFTSGLNESFFYAFATKDEADKYLTKIYGTDIQNRNTTVCSNGDTGFEYSYYNANRNTIVTECFVAENNKTAKEVALTKVLENIKKLVFATFSGNTLFGHTSIKQLACDSTLSSDCITNKDMFKFVYLKNTNGSISIAETCTDDPTNFISCIKVNAKIVKYNKTGSNNLTLEINGSNTKDTQAITVYSKEKGQSTKANPYTGEISLVSDTYYIFEEKDIPITFENYIDQEISPFTHQNTSYYAIFVDNSNNIEVYYENDNGESSNKLMNGDNRKTIMTNHNTYYLILKNENVTDFITAYEIHELKDDSGNIIEVYSYLRMQIDGVYVNINDYLVRETNRYYFKIPMSAEHKTEVLFIDRAGTTTTVIVSRSKIAPTISVTYEGSGANQTVKLSIIDTILVQTNLDTVKVLYSENGVDYSSTFTTNIKNTLLCNPNAETDVYECINKGMINGRNMYEVVINNVEQLYGFFKVELKDNHGNSNDLEFIYNPADLTVDYVTTDLQFITPTLDRENARMISKDSVQIKWNNEFNYLVLYKVTEGQLVEVCNTQNMSKGDYVCANKAENKIEAYINETTNKYEYSTLYYVDEGLYEAKLFNRMSIKINDRCYDQDGKLVEDCQEIRSESNNICSWENNPEYCASSFGIIQTVVEKVNVNDVYTRFEVDKTAPIYDLNDFVVEIPSGTVPFENNKEYTNAKVTINWDESFVRIWYTCQYVGESAGNTCVGNHGSFDNVTRSHIFEIDNKMSTKYTFWFEDIAGNTTQSSSLTVTINVVLPEIVVYKLDENGNIIPEETVKSGDRINKNTLLKCYFDGTEVNCAQTYDVKLYKFGSNGFELVTTPNNIYVSDNLENRYKYVVSIKSISGYVYTTLNTEIEFTIDKLAPHITVEGDKNSLWGIYKGSVTVLVDSDGVGTIYGKCIVTGEDAYGDKVYVCDEENPIITDFSARYDLTETGIYKVIAVDTIGNVTTGKDIKYITIDNDNPIISVKAQGDYLNYELSENGYTNANSVLVTSSDNNPESYFMYRVKKDDGEYGDWITHVSTTLTISEEGMYEVKPVDVVGNEGITRHFIIYRQNPKYYVYVNNKLNTINEIVREDAFITWDEPQYETQAPIVKVTMNGRPYSRRQVIKETGEYVFVFVDLAGNISTHKITINKNTNICLNNVNIVPNRQYLFDVNNIKLSGGEGYVFKENDVLIFATPTNYYNGQAGCGENVLSYKSIDKKSYAVLDAATARLINNNKNVPVGVGEEYTNKVNELGGFVYVIIVDKDVAKKDLGFAIGENFFTKDPLGWSIIFITGAAIIYVGLKLVVFKKKVKVLK